MSNKYLANKEKTREFKKWSCAAQKQNMEIKCANLLGVTSQK